MPKIGILIPCYNVQNSIAKVLSSFSADILAQALQQAKPARIHIISKMKEALPAPRPDLSPYAPRITSFMIKPEKIREVIGSGGKTINEIIANCPGVNAVPWDWPPVRK